MRQSRYESSSQRDVRDLDRRQIDQGNRMRLGAVQRAWVENHYLAIDVMLGNVAVPIAHQVVLARGDGLRQQPGIIAVQKGDAFAGQFEIAETIVARLSGRLDRGAQALAVVVNISEHEVRGPGLEQTHDVLGADVAAMDNELNFAALQHSDSLPRKVHVAVRVADDADSHRVFSSIA